MDPVAPRTNKLPSPEGAKESQQDGQSESESSNGRSEPSFQSAWFWAFLACAGATLALAVFFPDQNHVQQFYFRTMLALSIAGMGAVIPGLLEIEISWLRIVLRASGALGLFVLVFLINPPPLSTKLPVTIHHIEGLWQYRVTMQGSPFGDGTKERGGTARITTECKEWGIYVSVSGQRTWKRNTTDGERIPIGQPESFQTTRGSFSSADSINYEYAITDALGKHTGQTNLRLIADRGEVIRMEGTFQRYSSNVFGRIIYERSELIP